MRLFLSLATAVLFLLPSAASDQAANGRLQIHFMDVGQGDGAILISPQGESVLFDNGVRNDCDRPLSYLQQLGITSIDYHVASHYHDDHIGCTTDVLDEFPLNRFAFDRGGTYHTKTYDKYVAKVGAKRRTATVNGSFVLDATSAHPVRIEFVALNGAGIETENENDLSLVAVVRFGNFDAEIAGDLSGFKEGEYEDIETPVANLVGQVEVYKVHHHGSRYSSNRTWLDTVKPRVGIISAGEDNKHGHPTVESLERLHAKGVQLYWTSIGGGAEPESGFDTIGGNIIVEVVPGAQVFTVRHTSGTQTSTEFGMWGGPAAPTSTVPAFSWSKKSTIYHHTSCRYVANISPENLVTGNTIPVGKSLHSQCPR